MELFNFNIFNFNADKGMVSEDESSVSSYQAQLDLNGDVRLTKKG